MSSLTPYEFSLVTDAAIIRAKNDVIDKVASKFAALSERYQQVLVSVNDQPSTIPPKISKGEKYEGLPYLVLDYPRLFKQEGIQAIRTLFWWGNYFSITLHLQGKFQQQYLPNVEYAWKQNKFDNWQIQVGGDMWQHAVNENYIPVAQQQVEQLKQMDFIKLAKKIPLQEWDNIEALLMPEFTKLVEVLYAPMR
ncbi:hypothetical protein [Aridibaculum aurantiacum]|uniref:hypothetical protein n=1 Tax=Aridibaculum aurantiacum TaxID=2810307 RepID=UPI001A967752|nr:hypothetical protein [Aridibaculum aurantiacum]